MKTRQNKIKQNKTKRNRNRKYKGGDIRCPRCPKCGGSESVIRISGPIGVYCVCTNCQIEVPDI
jgi:hypothetical protein